MISKKDPIYVAGHNGLVGSAILRRLKNDGYKNIITVERAKLDLTNQQQTFNFLKKKKPKFIFICAAKVGGILTNDNLKAEFIFENLQIQNNLIHGAYLNKIKNKMEKPKSELTINFDRASKFYEQGEKVTGTMELKELKFSDFSSFKVTAESY